MFSYKYIFKSKLQLRLLNPVHCPLSFIIDFSVVKDDTMVLAMCGLHGTLSVASGRGGALFKVVVIDELLNFFVSQLFFLALDEEL